MNLRYRPSSRLILIGLLMLALLALNSFALGPAIEQKNSQLADRQATHSAVLQQLQQKPTDADKRLTEQLTWQGADWAQSTLEAMNAAQSSVSGIKASYSLGTPINTNLNGEDYWTQQLDLEIQATRDPALFSFIDAMLNTLPGIGFITSIQISADDKTGLITGTLSIALYRLVQP